VAAILLVRHGATEWSASGRHTGRTDVPLTADGRAQAERLGAAIAGWRFALMLTSPLSRAADTAALVGLAAAEADPDLVEWDYGDYEGVTSDVIRATVADWTVWTHPCPGGETAADVGARADRVLERCRPVLAAGGDVALVGHGHMLRVLTARWLGGPPAEGSRYALDTATWSVLDHERAAPVIRRWNIAPQPVL
jgi:probable phosphoglycerate mutase